MSLWRLRQCRNEFYLTNLSAVPRYCLALDLIDDTALIAEYEQRHEKIWPEIAASIRDSGITNLEIYRIGTRLFMVMETDAQFSFEKKAALDAANPPVKAWETAMWRYQKALSMAKPGEKWLLMTKIFDLKQQE